MSRKVKLITVTVLLLCCGTGFAWPSLLTLFRLKPSVYVVVLEHNWEETIFDRQYSEGEMLKAFLAGMKHVEVRHRYFTDAASLRKWCREIHTIPGPVVLLFSDHGSTRGLHADENEIGPRAIAEALADAKNLKMIHFSACSVFRGDFPNELLRCMGKERAVPVTGYVTNVDWTLSSLVDFMLVYLVAGEQRQPFQAWYQTRKMMPIACMDRVPGMDHAPLGLFIVMPEWVFAPPIALPVAVPVSPHDQELLDLFSDPDNQNPASLPK